MRALVISVTERGRALAERLPWEHVHGGLGETVRARWAETDALVLFVATGAAVRVVAPLLAAKDTDPAVVCVDEAGRFAVALCGGHAGGANDLARAVARRLGAEAVITTATDAVGVTGLDQIPGFTAAGDTAAVTAALLDGRPIRVENPLNWPVPLIHDPDGQVTVLVTDHRVAHRGSRAALHPPSLVAGVGTSTNAPPEELAALLAYTLAEAGLAPESVTEVATIDRRLTELAVVALRRPVRAFSAAALQAVDVPTPSETVRAAVGTPSVCEAAALLAAGPGQRWLSPNGPGGPPPWPSPAASGPVVTSRWWGWARATPITGPRPRNGPSAEPRW